MNRHRRELLHRLAAVDDHSVSNDEGSCVRTQPDDGGGDLFGLAYLSYQLLGDHLATISCIEEFIAAAQVEH